MNELKNLVFTEKYRPKHVKEIVGNFKNKILKYLENPETIPNFLFYSKTPGTGKTTLAKAIINDLRCDYIILNSSDDRKIEVIREKVKDFSMMKSSNGMRKCCFMDEFDGMLKDSQNALRNLMETYSNNIFFIMTCNNINKVIDPIKSRCVTIEFTTPNKEEIKNYLINICEKENIEYTDEGLNKLININYPSIRNCVTFLQDLYVQNKKLIPENIVKFNTIYDEIWNLIKQQKYIQVRNTIIEKNIDCEELNKYIFDSIIKDNNVELKKQIKIIPLLAVNERDFKLGADKTIIFLASIPKIMLILKGD